MNMNTLLYLKWIKDKDLLYSTGNSAPSYTAAWMGEEPGGKWMHVCVRLSPSAARLNLAQHCSSVILQYKIDSCFFFLKKKKQICYFGDSVLHISSKSSQRVASEGRIY